MVSVGGIVQVNLPADEWCAVPYRDGMVFVTQYDFTACAGIVEAVNFIFLVGILDEVPYPEAVEALMRRRVRQGDPERASAVVAGSPALRFDFTSNETFVRSHFVQHGSGKIVELTFSGYLEGTTLPKYLDPESAELLGHVAWVEAAGGQR
jgi:hypothetical protein